MVGVTRSRRKGPQTSAHSTGEASGLLYMVAAKGTEVIERESRELSEGKTLPDCAEILHKSKAYGEREVAESPEQSDKGYSTGLPWTEETFLLEEVEERASLVEPAASRRWGVADYHKQAESGKSLFRRMALARRVGASASDGTID